MLYKLDDIGIESLNKKRTYTDENGKLRKINVSSGNIEQLNKDIYTFVEYNLLPGKKGTLDGHYRFTINIKTGEYLVNQDSFYGGLTYVAPPRVQGFIELNEFDKPIAEAILSAKLLGAYFYDACALFRKGKNLLSDGTPPEFDHKNYIGESIFKHNDGVKRNLITESYSDNEMKKKAFNMLKNRRL